MTHRIVRRLALAGALVPALTFSATFTLALSAAPAAQAEGEDLDQLFEDLRVAMTRLRYSLEKMQNISFALGGDDSQQRKDLIRRCKAELEEARGLRVTEAAPVEEAIERMSSLRDEANDFLKSVQPLWGEGSPQRGKSERLDSTYVEVLKFRESLDNARSVSRGLSEDENQQVGALAQAGEDTILVLKETKETDHVATEEQLRKLLALRRELDDLYARGMSTRGKGFAFVALDRAQHQWTDVSYAENQFTAMRTRFLAPQSAYVTVRNDSEQMRPLFVELSFYTSTGAETGTAVYETQRLEEMKPGEVREILVPILPTHPQFWEVTRGYTVHLN